MQPTETSEGFCPVCGQQVVFSSFESTFAPCKRNTFICSTCGSCARNRHIALAILDHFNFQRDNNESIRKLSLTWNGTIFLTCTSGALHDAFTGGVTEVFASEFIDGVPSGSTKNGIMCQDIQRTSFSDAKFDIVVTEDVMEHVPNPKQAFAEIRRILKPGGFHIATIPVNWSRSVTATRAVLANGSIFHLMEPEYHGDPTRPEGVLAFSDYGHDLIEEYLSITGPSNMLAANGDKIMEERYGIFNSWVFISVK